MTLKIIERVIQILFFFIPIFLIFGTLLPEISIILISFLFLIYSFIKKDFLWIRDNDTRLLLILYFLLIINYLFSLDQNLSILRNLGFIKYILFILAIKNLVMNNFKVLSKILKFWSIFFLFIITDLYFEYFVGHNIFKFQSPDETRLIGVLKDELKIGSYLLGFLFPIIFFWYYQTFEINLNKQFSKIKKTIFIVITILSLFIFLPIGQRTIVVKLFFVFLFIYYFFPKINLYKKILSLLIFCLAGFVIVSSNLTLKTKYVKQIFFPDIATKNQNFGNAVSSVKKNYQSSHYWKHHYSAYLIFKDYPLSGVGNKNYRKICREYSDKVDQLSLKFNSRNFIYVTCSTHPHQIYYEFLSEHGIIGIFFMILLSSFFIRKLLLFSKNNNLFLLGSFSFFLITFFPLLPSGSFFTSFNAIIFWINFCFILINQEDFKNNLKDGGA